jgi:hypothetical protein
MDATSTVDLETRWSPPRIPPPLPKVDARQVDADQGDDS